MPTPAPRSGTPTRLAVLGAAGRTGQLVVASALARGHEVTAIVRNEQRAQTVAADHADPLLRTATADVTDAAALSRALAGTDVALSSVGTSGRDSHGLYEASGRALVTAAKAAGVGKLIVVSSGGVDQDDKGLPWWYRRIVAPRVLGAMYDDMRAMEEVIRTGGLPWTLARAAYLVDSTATASPRVEDGRNPAHGWRLPRATLAEFLVDAATTDTWTNRTPTLAL